MAKVNMCVLRFGVKEAMYKFQVTTLQKDATSAGLANESDLLCTWLDL